MERLPPEMITSIVARLDYVSWTRARRASSVFCCDSARTCQRRRRRHLASVVAAMRDDAKVCIVTDDAAAASLFAKYILWHKRHLPSGIVCNGRSTVADFTPFVSRVWYNDALIDEVLQAVQNEQENRWRRLGQMPMPHGSVSDIRQFLVVAYPQAKHLHTTVLNLLAYSCHMHLFVLVVLSANDRLHLAPAGRAQFDLFVVLGDPGVADALRAAATLRSPTVSHQRVVNIQCADVDAMSREIVRHKGCAPISGARSAECSW